MYVRQAIELCVLLLVNVAVVMPWLSYVDVCVSVCPACALIFDSLDLETSFVVYLQNI